ncbi:MAG: MFS transporter [Deltaproteobacteria bacterium]|nr:MFS transporter [Deltaproteobacteria bacterium]
MKILLLLFFWFLWYTNFSTRTILSPFLPIIEEQLSLSHALSGSIFSFMAAGYTLGLFLSGLLAPRMGYKRSIMLGFLILGISLFSIDYASAYFSISIAYFFVGVGSGMYLPSAVPLLTSSFGRANWGKAISFHETAASFSILSVPILAALLLRFFQWRETFLFLSTFCLAALFGIWAFAPNLKPTEESKGSVLQVFKRSDFWIMAVLWGFASASSMGTYSVIPLFLVKEKGIGLEIANTVFGLSRVGGFFMTMAAGLLADRFGTRKILFLTLMITGFATMGLAVAPPLSFLVLALVVQGTLGPAFFPVGMVSISKTTSLAERSAFIGVSISIGVVSGLGLTPPLLGAVADAWNFALGLLALGLLIVLASFLIRKLPSA